MGDGFGLKSFTLDESLELVRDGEFDWVISLGGTRKNNVDFRGKRRDDFDGATSFALDVNGAAVSLINADGGDGSVGLELDL